VRVAAAGDEPGQRVFICAGLVCGSRDQEHGLGGLLFGATPADVKTAIPKLNEPRVIVKIVANDEDLIHAVGAMPGAVGILDVYSINSSVKVLRLDGKLLFGVGYALKGN
jgi:hypothetical protein